MINEEFEAEDYIPVGHYCYKVTGYNKENDRLKIESCPFHVYQGNGLHFCRHLNEYGLDANTTEEEYQILIKRFGSEERLHEITPLFLLFDSVKECGVNNISPYEYLFGLED